MKNETVLSETLPKDSAINLTIKNKVVRDENVGWKFWQKRRHVVGIFVFFGFFTSYLLRLNLSIAIVVMTQDSPGKKAEFNWDATTKGILLGSFFYGYICTQFLGGWLSSKIGGSKVFSFGIGITAFLSIATPFLARIDVYLLIALRIIEGIFEGVTIPSVNSIWANWAPIFERSKLATRALSGISAGVVFAMSASGLMAQRFGWPSLFYVYGLFGIFWFALWCFYVSDKPEDDPWISDSELIYIQQSRDNDSQNKQIAHPWKEIFMSRPVWVVILAHFCENWGYLTLVTQLPMFMSDTLQFKIDATGLIAALPYIGTIIVMMISGPLADYLRSNNYLNTTQVRKLFTCSGFLLQMIFMIAAGCSSSKIGIIICIVIGASSSGIVSAGYLVNYLDLAPQHASILLGIGSTIATIPGIISPSLTSLIVKNGSAEEWRIIFVIVGTIYLIGAIVYGIFASGEKQKWTEKSNKPISMII